MSSIRRQVISVLRRQRGVGNLAGFQVPYLSDLSMFLSENRTHFSGPCSDALRDEMDAALRVPSGSACCTQSLLDKATSLVLRGFASIRHPPATPNCMRSMAPEPG